MTPVVRFSNIHIRILFSLSVSWNSVRFLLNVERDEFVLSRRRASFVFTPGGWHEKNFVYLVFVMRLIIYNSRLGMYSRNLLLFTYPSAVNVTAAICLVSKVRLQFWFFLNLVSCLLRANSSRRNYKSRAGPKKLLNFGRNGNRQWILIHVISLPPKMFTRPRQDTNDSLYV